MLIHPALVENIVFDEMAKMQFLPLLAKILILAKITYPSPGVYKGAHVKPPYPESTERALPVRGQHINPAVILLCKITFPLIFYVYTFSTRRKHSFRRNGENAIFAAPR